MKVWVFTLLGLLACGKPRLGLLYTGRDAELLATSLEPQAAAINAAARCDTLTTMPPINEGLMQVDVSVNAEILKAYDMVIGDGGQTLGMFCPAGAYEDANLYLVPFHTPAVVLPTGFDLGQPVGADQAWLALDAIQVVFTHEIGHALGLSHQPQGVMFAYIDFRLTPDEAAQSLAATLAANGLNPCHH